MRDHDHLPELAPGSVWLVGAGPGDPGLLSWLAVKALRSADAVLHDAAIEADALAPAREGSAFLEAVRDDESGRAEALRRAIKLAKDGWRVALLVEGDPLAQPHGVEAALALAEADVLGRVVPGITAGVAGLSYAGVPVTQRDVTSAVCFLDLGAAENVAALPAALAVLVAGVPTVLAGVRPALVAEVARTLIAAGVATETRVLLVARPTSLRQEVVETDLAGCIAGPLLWAAERTHVMGVGSIVDLRRRLAWREHAPRFVPPPIATASLAGVAG